MLCENIISLDKGMQVQSGVIQETDHFPVILAMSHLRSGVKNKPYQLEDIHVIFSRPMKNKITYNLKIET